MSENSNYEDMIDLNYAMNNLSPQQQAIEEQKAKMLADYRKSLATRQIIDPMASAVDFFANTYRGGKVGGGQSVAQNVATSRPAISEQANLIGWMGKPAVSGGQINPLQLAKFKYQQERDKEKSEKSGDEMDLKYSKEIDNRFNQSFKSTDLTKFKTTVGTLKNAFEDGDVSKVNAALTQYLRLMSEVGNTAVREKEGALFKTIESTFEDYKKRFGSEGRYSQEQMQPLIDMVNAAIDARKNGYSESIDEIEASLTTDPTFSGRDLTISSSAARRKNELNKVPTAIEYKGTRQGKGGTKEERLKSIINSLKETK